MDIVLTHIGAGLPEYVHDCIKQVRIFNPQNRIFFITDRKNHDHGEQLLGRYGVRLVVAEDYADERVREVSRSAGKVDSLKRFIKRDVLKRKDADFWVNTTVRLFYLENFARKFGLLDFCHFENDVMLYFPVDEFGSVFRNYQNIAITPGSDIQVMTGFAYFRSWKSLRNLNDFIVETFKVERTEELKARYKSSIMNEMLLMRAFADERGSEYMHFLPILPDGEMSRGFHEFGSVFDPASYGQYVGGTFGGDPDGFIDPLHYIGKELSENSGLRVNWHVENGRKVPYLHYDDRKARINNLHIHSKELSRFSS